MKEPDPEPAASGGGREGRSRRTVAGARKLRPLHTPAPVALRTDDEGRPRAVGSEDGDRFLEVLQIREVWRIDDEWWREPVSRLYFEVVLESGERIVLYRDLVEGGWYRQRG